LKRDQRQAGQPRSVLVQPHFAPRNSRIFPKIPLSITQFTPTPNFGNLERKF
jgi:hypothetical protein